MAIVLPQGVLFRENVEGKDVKRYWSLYTFM